MAVRRHYIETSDVSGSTTAQVQLAEELIDRYVGPQDKHIKSIYHGEVTAVTNSNKTIADTSSDTQLSIEDNYFANCVLEIIGGTGVGSRAVIESSDKSDKTVTLRAALATTPDTTSVFKIYQLAKFPRRKDIYVSPTNTVYYKSIPEAVREACIAQVKFIIAQGDSFFTTDDGDKQSESIGNYSYSIGGSGGSMSALVRLIAPQARTLLRGIKNSKGNMLLDSPRVMGHGGMHHGGH